jgi:hypothetical protein
MVEGTSRTEVGFHIDNGYWTEERGKGALLDVWTFWMRWDLQRKLLNCETFLDETQMK